MSESGNRFDQAMQDKTTRRVFLGGLGAAAAMGATVGKPVLAGIQEHFNNEPRSITAPEVKEVPEKHIVFLGRNEDDSLKVDSHPDYLSVRYFATVPSGEQTLFPKLHVLDGGDTFDDNKNPPRIVEPDSFDENVCLVRVGVKADNESRDTAAANELSMTLNDPNDLEQDWDVWLALADQEHRDPLKPVWVNEKREVVEYPLIVSPIFVNTNTFSPDVADNS